MKNYLLQLSIVLFAVNFLFAQTTETEPNGTITDGTIITISSNGDFQGTLDPFFEGDLWKIAAGSSGNITINYSGISNSTLKLFSNSGDYGFSTTEFTITTSGSQNITLVGSTFYLVQCQENVFSTGPYSFTISGALPVELSSFTAILQNQSVELNWQTATEVNNYGFNVEQRIENGEWEIKSFVQGNGTTNSPKQYSFTDTDLPDANEVSYRLKQIDNDGTFTYSKIVTVDLSSITDVDDEINYEFALAQNYPNPFNPSTTIKFTVPSEVKGETSNVKLIIFDILGREMAVLVNQKLQPGNHEVSFNADSFASGIYLYRIAIHSDKLTAGSFVQTKKMIMIK